MMKSMRTYRSSVLRAIRWLLVALVLSCTLEAALLSAIFNVRRVDTGLESIFRMQRYEFSVFTLQRCSVKIIGNSGNMGYLN